MRRETDHLHSEMARFTVSATSTNSASDLLLSVASFSRTVFAAASQFCVWWCNSICHCQLQNSLPMQRHSRWPPSRKLQTLVPAVMPVTFPNCLRWKAVVNRRSLSSSSLTKKLEMRKWLRREKQEEGENINFVDSNISLSKKKEKQMSNTIYFLFQKKKETVKTETSFVFSLKKSLCVKKEQKQKGRKRMIN